jgi:hypothetical protein
MNSLTGSIPISLVVGYELDYEKYKNIEEIFDIDINESIKFYTNNKELNLDNGDFYGTMSVKAFNKVVFGMLIEDDIDIENPNKTSCSLEIFKLIDKIENLVAKAFKKNKALKEICEDSKIKMHFMVC